MTYLILNGRGDRLGSQIHNYIFQIIYAVHFKYYIKYDTNLPFINNIFMKCILEYVNIYNNTLNEDFTILFETLHTEHMFFIAIHTIINLNCDTYTYFKKNILENIKPNLLKNSTLCNYHIPFNPHKTILVHLRLEDVKNRNDYDGSISSNYYRENINHGNNIGIVIELDNYNICSPLSYNKIQQQIDNALEKYNDYEVIIITSPNEPHILPYKYIQNNDPSYDLFLLCNSEVVILSRSTFSLASLFFGIQKEVYVPLWGFAVSNGLYTKYDNCNYNYFF